MTFFTTDWATNHKHFGALADAITFARTLGASAVVYGKGGEVLWHPACD